jgi:hypothetical protein
VRSFSSNTMRNLELLSMRRFSTEELQFARLGRRLEPSRNSPLHCDRAQRGPANQPPEHDDGLGRSNSSSANFGNRRPRKCPPSTIEIKKGRMIGEDARSGMCEFGPEL